MEPKPKERIVFDEDSYYGDEGEKMAIDDLMERNGLTEDEVRESFTDDEVFQHAMKLRDFAPPPVTWSSPSDALLRNTRKRKGRSLTISPPANGVCILSTPESVTVSMVA